MTTMNDIQAKRLELEAAKAKAEALEREIAEERKVLRARTLNEIVNAATEAIDAFGDETLFADVAREIADLAPRKTRASNGTRLSGDEKAKRDADIADALRNGKTAAEVAALFSVSEGTVNIIKRNAGLVVARKATPVQPATGMPEITVQPVNLS